MEQPNGSFKGKKKIHGTYVSVAFASGKVELRFLRASHQLWNVRLHMCVLENGGGAPMSACTSALQWWGCCTTSSAGGLVTFTPPIIESDRPPPPHTCSGPVIHVTRERCRTACAVRAPHTESGGRNGGCERMGAAKALKCEIFTLLSRIIAKAAYIKHWNPKPKE